VGKDKKDITSTHYKKPISGIIGTGLVCFIALLLFRPSNLPCQASSSPVGLAKAAIVDHLSTSWPNPAFVKECTALLKRAGYSVDYYKGEEVTVDFYRDLPTHGYKLIVLRVHSAYIHKYLSLAMFTSEPYSKNRYVYDQLRNRVASGYIEPYHKGDPRYLVITDKFIRYNMKGSFDNAIVIMMGCMGIKQCAATAFIERGAQAYIGWDGLVSARHTDMATIQILKQLLQENQSIGMAVKRTMETVGIDRKHKSMLLYWPIKAGNFSIDTPEDMVARAPTR